jgi:hypothetical protein
MTLDNRTFLRSYAIILAVLLLFTGYAAAQTTTQGSITGTTLDGTGAVIPNATVKIVNNGTNMVTTLKSDNSGVYVAPLLEPGDYTVTVSAAGFKTTQLNHVIVQVGQATELPTKLSVGETATVVEVTREAPILNFESPDFSSNINTVALDKCSHQQPALVGSGADNAGRHG